MTVDFDFLAQIEALLELLAESDCQKLEIASNKKYLISNQEIPVCTGITDQNQY